MSKTPEQEAAEVDKMVELMEAEIASLKEELWSKGILPKRKVFIVLRLDQLEKQIPEITAKAKQAVAHMEWLARINHPKRT